MLHLKFHVGCTSDSLLKHLRVTPQGLSKSSRYFRKLSEIEEYFGMEFHLCKLQIKYTVIWDKGLEHVSSFYNHVSQGEAAVNIIM